jgi:hypothetical protein
LIINILTVVLSFSSASGSRGVLAGQGGWWEPGCGELTGELRVDDAEGFALAGR